MSATTKDVSLSKKEFTKDQKNNAEQGILKNQSEADWDIIWEGQSLNLATHIKFERKVKTKNSNTQSTVDTIINENDMIKSIIICKGVIKDLVEYMIIIFNGNRLSKEKLYFNDFHEPDPWVFNDSLVQHGSCFIQNKTLNLILPLVLHINETNIRILNELKSKFGFPNINFKFACKEKNKEEKEFYECLSSLSTLSDNTINSLIKRGKQLDDARVAEKIQDELWGKCHGDALFFLASRLLEISKFNLSYQAFEHIEQNSFYYQAARISMVKILEKKEITEIVTVQGKKLVSSHRDYQTEHLRQVLYARGFSKRGLRTLDAYASEPGFARDILQATRKSNKTHEFFDAIIIMADNNHRLKERILSLEKQLTQQKTNTKINMKEESESTLLPAYTHITTTSPSADITIAAPILNFPISAARLDSK